ncbi:hypothetical protein [Facilibium subflavum]|uniref:hypothetical protein n=1 Tax=Facilibium subflavum TaxID=2219058 RepID=UPI000E649038|nr:hypothetical protein [Facilibium subflavum]
MIVSRSNIICQYTGAFFLRIAKQAKKLGLKLLQGCDANQFKITQDKAGNMLIRFDSGGQQNTLSLYEFIQQDHHTKLIGEQKMHF